MGLLTLHKIPLSSLRRFSSKVMRYLNVAEKNDAAKGISAILSKGASNRREGLSKFNKIYEFEATLFGQRAKMVMTSVSGHLLNFAFHPSFKHWESCDAAQLFDAPILEICLDDYQNIKKTIEREIRSCDGLILWTDCDREGENIGFEIIKVCKDVKANIPVYRAKFSEITGPSIFRALSNLGQPNKNVSDAVDVRKELDLRTGAAFTRLLTLHLQKTFPAKLSDRVISYGSCQFPTLGFVVDRYLSIENFIPETFWKIKMNHKVKELITEFLWKRDRLFDKNACEAILDICKESNNAKVESVNSKSKSKWRPLPLDTVEMEKNISKKLRINAKTAMSIAEKLYTQGFISYPRTETNIYPKELNLSNIVEQQINDGNWGTFAQRIMSEGGPTPRVGKKSDQAHPPIHPTKHAPNLSGQEKSVYEYIVRHFLASVHKDAQGFETTVTVDIADEKFIAKGLVILEKNYLDVYIYEKWTGKEINNYQEGDTFTPTTLEMAEGNTSPPKLLTESELIALMDKHGIGTDATHAEHIDKIQTREYVGLHDNTYFVPGTLGMSLVQGYNNIGLEVSLAKPNLRAEFENDLKLICDGQKNADVVRREQIAKYKAVYQTVFDKIGEIDKCLADRLGDTPVQIRNEPRADPSSGRPVLKCPKCGNYMFFRNRKNGPGKYLSCAGFPGCKNGGWPSVTIDSVEVLDECCTNCGPETKKVKMKFRQNPFIGEPNPSVLCIGGCDINVLESLDISPSIVRRQANGSIVERNDSRGQQNRDNTAVQNEYNRRSNNSGLAENFPGQMENTFRRPNNVMPVQQTINNRNNNQNVSDSDIVCPCENAAVLLTCRTSKNNGRQFYKCASNTCDFFLWKPGDVAPSAPTNEGTPSSAVPDCRCNQPSKLFTVAKQNENHGRKFYSCAKQRPEGCGFFKWADEVQQNVSSDNPWNDGGGGGNSSGTQNSRNNRARSNANDGRNKPRAKRKCGICGQEGHTRQRCPRS